MNELDDIPENLHRQLNSADHESGKPFKIPDHYFSEIERQVLAKIMDEEEADVLIPFADAGKKPTFSVPEAYFDHVGKELLKKTALPPVKKLFPKKWMQIAAAAITGCIILTGIYHRENANRQQIAIQNHSNNRPAIQNISATELTDFVEEGSGSNIGGVDRKNTVDINQLFQQVSSQDLENFLSETTAGNNEFF